MRRLHGSRRFLRHGNQRDLGSLTVSARHCRASGEEHSHASQICFGARIVELTSIRERVIALHVLRDAVAAVDAGEVDGAGENQCGQWEGRLVAESAEALEKSVDSVRREDDEAELGEVMPFDRRAEVVAERQRIDEPVDGFAITAHREEPEDERGDREEEDLAVAPLENKPQKRQKAGEESDVERMLTVVALARAERTAQRAVVAGDPGLELTSDGEGVRTARVAVNAGNEELERVFGRHRPVRGKDPAFLRVVFRGTANGLSLLGLLVTAGEGVDEGAAEAGKPDHKEKRERHERSLPRKLALADAAADEIRGCEYGEEKPEVRLIEAGPGDRCAEDRPILELALADGAIGESERENAVRHPLEPAEMSGGKEREPVAGKGEQESGAVRGKPGESASAAEVRHAERGAGAGERVLEFGPQIRRSEKLENVAGDEFSDGQPGIEKSGDIIRRIRHRAIRHDRRNAESPRPPENETRQHRVSRGEGGETSPLGTPAHQAILASAMMVNTIVKMATVSMMPSAPK